MNKTKLGISPKAYAALTFIAGLGGILPVLLMAGVVLLIEDNDWLKRTVAKAAAFLLIVSLVLAFIGCFDYIFVILGNILSIFDASYNFSTLNEIISLFENIIYFGTDICLIMFAFAAGSGKYVQIPVIDTFIDGNM